MLNVVGIGGGTGLPVLLRGLALQRDVNVTAIVTVSDNGGSTGPLRDSMSIPAIGDLRNCIVALTDPDSALAALFQHRFSVAGELDGHAVGNLIMAALYQQTGSLRGVMQKAAAIMPLKGRAMAVTEMPATLCALFRDGSAVRGEYQIAAAGKEIERVWLEPHNPPPASGVLEALQNADAIVFAPGSLFTSIVPNLLVDGVADAIRRSRATRIMVCNLMTQPGETDGFTASDHLRVIENYLGSGGIQIVVCEGNGARARSGRSGVVKPELVVFDRDELQKRGVVPVKASLADFQNGRFRHDAAGLGSMIVKLARTYSTPVPRPAEAPLAVEDSLGCLTQAAI